MYLLIPVCLITAGAFLWMEKRECFVRAVILKGLASLCFVILGLLCSPGTQMAKLIVIGLVLGCVADVMLNLRWVFKGKGQLIFLIGILVFLSGHIFYLAAVLPMCRHRLLFILIGVLLTAILMAWILRYITAKKAFKVFGVFYIGAIMILNCVAAGNLISNPTSFTRIFAAGAILFLISDIVLILNTFGAKSRMSLRITNISLYYIGQLLIALSLLFV